MPPVTEVSITPRLSKFMDTVLMVVEAEKTDLEVVRRANLDPARVDQVLWGCVSQVGEQAFNFARWSLLQAGYPIEVPGTTLDFQCGSSQQAVQDLLAKTTQADPGTP